MARLAISMALLLTGLTTHAAQAQSEDIDPEVVTLADAHGLDPTDLAGAVNTLTDAGYAHIDAKTYLIAEGVLAPPPTSAAPAIPDVWQRIAQCESGGNWHANTGNGFYGGLQENRQFWADYGGLAYAARPDLASPAAQVAVAIRGQAVQGWNAWPVCSRRAGLR